MKFCNWCSTKSVHWLIWFIFDIWSVCVCVCMCVSSPSALCFRCSLNEWTVWSAHGIQYGSNKYTNAKCCLSRIITVLLNEQFVDMLHVSLFYCNKYSSCWKSVIRFFRHAHPLAFSIKCIYTFSVEMYTYDYGVRREPCAFRSRSSNIWNILIKVNIKRCVNIQLKTIQSQSISEKERLFL